MNVFSNNNETLLHDTTNTSTNVSSFSNAYKDGQVIEQKWHVAFIFLAYAMAFIGSYAAIRLLEHGLWRSDREREHATLLSRYPKFATAVVLGSCTIWSMHFVGMQAVEQKGVDVCYYWLPTLGSVCLSITGVWVGVSLASYDIFAGEDRVKTLKELLLNDPMVCSKQNRRRASNHIRMVALFHKLHWIAAGSIATALGALSMHYVGMIAMKGPFRREWTISYVAGSVLLGVAVAFAGFWILFRPLHWKVEKAWYRQASAAVIALAVCMLHFMGMLSVTYIADSSQDVGYCSKKDFQGWQPEQLKVLLVAVTVPFVAFLVEHTISNELRGTYRQLLDINTSLFMNSSTNIGSSGSTNIGSSGSLFSTRSRHTATVRISGLDDVPQLKPYSLMSEGSTVPEHQRNWGVIYCSAVEMSRRDDGEDDATEEQKVTCSQEKTGDEETEESQSGNASSQNFSIEPQSLQACKVSESSRTDVDVEIGGHLAKPKHMAFDCA